MNEQRHGEMEYTVRAEISRGLRDFGACRACYDLSMANPEKYPPPVMAKKFGIGKLTRHLFICLGPDCSDLEQGEKTWLYIKDRLKQLNLTGEDGPVYRTK